MVSTVSSDRILLGVAINRSKENKWREISNGREIVKG